MPDIDSFRGKLKSLIFKFEKDKPHYLSKGYPEAQVRIDFINPLFKIIMGSPPSKKIFSSGFLVS